MNISQHDVDMPQLRLDRIYGINSNTSEQDQQLSCSYSNSQIAASNFGVSKTPIETPQLNSQSHCQNKQGFFKLNLGNCLSTLQNKNANQTVTSHQPQVAVVPLPIAATKRAILSSPDHHQINNTRKFGNGSGQNTDGNEKFGHQHRTHQPCNSEKFGKSSGYSFMEQSSTPSSNKKRKMNESISVLQYVNQNFVNILENRINSNTIRNRQHDSSQFRTSSLNQEQATSGEGSLKKQSTNDDIQNFMTNISTLNVAGIPDSTVSLNESNNFVSDAPKNGLEELQCVTLSAINPVISNPSSDVDNDNNENVFSMLPDENDVDISYIIDQNNERMRAIPTGSIRDPMRPASFSLPTSNVPSSGNINQVMQSEMNTHSNNYNPWAIGGIDSHSVEIERLFST